MNSIVFPYWRKHAMLVTGILVGASVIVASGADVASRVRTVRIPGGLKPIKAQTSVDGTIHVVLDGENGPFYVRSKDDGETFSAPLGIVDAASKKPGLKFSVWDLAVGKDGRVHVAMGNNAWKLKLPQDQWSLYYATLGAGDKAFAPVRNLNRKPSEGFSLAANERGAVLASFLSGRLYAMSSQDDGVTFSPSAEIDPEWNPCDCCTTSAVLGKDGKVAVMYREETNNDRDIYLALWDPASREKPIRKRVSETSWNVNACPMTYFTIAPGNDGYVAAWPTKGRIYFARLNQNGEVLPPGEIQTPGTSGMRTGLVALSATDGTTLVAWKNRDVLGWQLYGDDGAALGNPGSIESAGNGAAGAVLRNGNFLLFP